IADVSIVSNQTTSVPEYPVGADIIPMFGATLARAELMYSLDGGTNWTPVTMTTVSGDSMVGVIPQQPLGSVVLYYLEAEDNNGRVFQYPQNAGWQNAEYYSFGVYSPNTQTLDMDFEEGSGTPVDNSGYANPVTVFGSPSHETDAAAGTYSLYLEGDSSLLEIDAPFLAAKEFLVDVWVKPDPRLATTDFQYCRFLNRPRNAASWADNNYQLRFNPGGVLYAGTDGSYTITMDDSMQMDTWNHIMLEVRDAPAGDTVAHYAVLRWADANDNIIQQKYVGFDADIVEGFAPLRIGKAAGTDPVPGAYPPFYKGYYDNIKIYNYPAANLPLQNLTNIDGKENNLLYSYELSQNYPNPFNPVTDIKFSLAKTGKVQLVVYDILGRKVKTLINSTMTFGKHSTQWNGTDEFGNRVSSGIYFYRLDTKEFKQTKKMILMK
ncbi:MAG: T9SS C-terminal target domain-containing protein, partial [Calditrichaeota bacterium]